MSHGSRHPPVKWAQRSDKIFITVELPDTKDVKLKLEPEGKFFFSAMKDSTPYEVDLELLDKVNVEESKYNVGVRNIVYVIQKAEKKWWSRLLKQQGKLVFLQVDWDKWVDEDEENEKGSKFDDMDFSKLGMGGADDFDMDDANDEEEGKTASKEAGEDESVAPAGEKSDAKEESTDTVAQEAKA